MTKTAVGLAIGLILATFAPALASAQEDGRRGNPRRRAHHHRRHHCRQDDARRSDRGSEPRR